MKAPALALLLGGCGLLLALAPQLGHAAQLADADADDDGGAPDDGGAAAAPFTTDTADFAAWATWDDWHMTTPTIERHRAAQLADADGNVSAFLAMISRAEGTDKRADPYRVCYGYRHTIRSFADHPSILGEWAGESLASLGPAYAGKVSTAAGRYQIIRPTWVGVKRALGLRDFAPAAQDAAAVHLIKQRGALDDVRAGRIKAAIDKCRAEWASLPGAGYGQPERSLAMLLGAYADAGGVLA